MNKLLIGFVALVGTSMWAVPIRTATSAYLSATPSESRLDAFSEEAVKVLGNDLARHAFGVLGSTPESTSDTQQPDCYCKVGLGWKCQEGSTCKGRKWIIFDACRDTEFGCGFFFMEECDGLCFGILPPDPHTD